MSAYALPGFFPPLESSLSFKTTQSAYDSVNALAKEEKIDFDESPLPNQSITVDVKGAKIDPVRLIHVLTSKTIARGCPPSDTQVRSRTRRRNQSIVAPEPCTPQENAVELELDVCYNGRRYTAVRSLCQVLQLRRDLVEELEDRRNPADNVVPSIPCVPRLPEDSANAACGFTRLQALLRSYAPSLESWLHQVLRQVPTRGSLVWGYFLWEPTEPVKLLEHNSSSSLDKIEESDTEHDFDE